MKIRAPFSVGAELDRPTGRVRTAGAIAGVIAVAGAATGLAVIVNAIFGLSEYDIVILFGVNAVLVVGLQAFVGNTGIMSFGNIAFMGVGAYAAGIVTVPALSKSTFLPNLPPFLANLNISVVPAIMFAGGCAAVLGLIAGVLVVRVSESAASIVTFALLVIMNNVFQNATSITRGNQTFLGVPPDATIGLVFGTLIAVVALSAVFKWSPLGLRARAVREDPIAAEVSGIRVATARLWPFVLSAFISGIGGALWAFEVTAFSASDFYISQVIVAISMMILGGYRSISGCIVGATVMSIWLELARHLENGVTIAGLQIPALIGISQLSVGVALILVLRWRPAGLVGPREIELRGPRR